MLQSHITYLHSIVRELPKAKRVKIHETVG